MIFIDTLRMAIFEFTSNKLRTGLTMLGIVIGVGAVIALMAAGQGAQSGVTNKVRGLGSNLIFIKPATTGSAGGGVRNLRALTLTTDDAAILRDTSQFPEIEAVVSQFGGSDTSADTSQPTLQSQVIGNGRKTAGIINTTEPALATARFCSMRGWVSAIGERRSRSIRRRATSRARSALPGSTTSTPMPGSSRPTSCGAGTRRWV